MSHHIQCHLYLATELPIKNCKPVFKIYFPTQGDVVVDIVGFNCCKFCLYLMQIYRSITSLQ